ncbi:MAG: hypothetical protein HZA15_14875 [Nitrospirae bacterium]|nr:hypothetical protein [Nitrospirota bacterium]
MARPKKNDDVKRKFISTRIDEKLYDEARIIAINNKKYHGVYEIIEEALKDYLSKLKGEA